MAQNKKQNQIEDQLTESDENVWRAIHYLDPDGAKDWHYLAFIFGCLALVILVFAIAAWVR